MQGYFIKIEHLFNALIYVFIYVQALGGFIIVVQDDGQIFYATPSIQEHLGFQDVSIAKGVTLVYL